MVKRQDGHHLMPWFDFQTFQNGTLKTFGFQMDSEFDCSVFGPPLLVESLYKPCFNRFHVVFFNNRGTGLFPTTLE